MSANTPHICSEVKFCQFNPSYETFFDGAVCHCSTSSFGCGDLLCQQRPERAGRPSPSVRLHRAAAAGPRWHLEPDGQTLFVFVWLGLRGVCEGVQQVTLRQRDGLGVGEVWMTTCVCLCVHV